MLFAECLCTIFFQQHLLRDKLVVAEAMWGELRLSMSSWGLCPYFAQGAVCKRGTGWAGQTCVVSLEPQICRSHPSHPGKRHRVWFRLPNALRSFTEKEFLCWCCTKISPKYPRACCQGFGLWWQEVGSGMQGSSGDCPAWEGAESQPSLEGTGCARVGTLCPGKACGRRWPGLACAMTWLRAAAAQGQGWGWEREGAVIPEMFPGHLCQPQGAQSGHCPSLGAPRCCRAPLQGDIWAGGASLSCLEVSPGGEQECGARN